MLFATIGTSLTKGWFSGPKVVSGHALIELVIFVLIVAGFSTQGVVLWISIVGGAVLVVFGIMTIKEGKHATLSGGCVQKPVCSRCCHIDFPKIK